MYSVLIMQVNCFQCANKKMFYSSHNLFSGYQNVLCSGFLLMLNWNCGFFNFCFGKAFVKSFLGLLMKKISHNVNTNRYGFKAI